MQSKDAKKSRVGTPVSGHPANKNININISYNITLGRNNQPTLINSLIEGDGKNKKSAVQPQTVKAKNTSIKEKLQTQPPVATKQITLPVEEFKGRQASNHHPLNLINSYLEGKINKAKRRKKNLSNLSRLEKEFRMPTTKIRTQEASTTNISETKPRRGMSVGRVDTKMHKSGQNSRRNNSDGSRKQLSKEYRKKSEKRKGSWSAVGTKNKTKKISFKSQDRSPSNQKVQKRRKTEICIKTQELEEPGSLAKESLVQKLIRTEITSVGCMNAQQSPIGRLPSTQQKTNQSWDTRWNELSSSVFMKPKHNRTKSKHCLTDRLRKQAILTIQKAWKNFKKRQVTNLYSAVFNRHCPEKKPATPKFIEEQRQPQEPPVLIVEQPIQFTQKSEEASEQFQFNIKKYEDMVSQSINAQRNRQTTYDSDHEVSVSTDKQKYSSPKQINQADEIEYFKAHQLQQWNKINIMISQQIKEGTQYEKLLQELIKHTEMNKRWIEEQTSPKESSNKFRYRELAEQPGIFQKLKKKSSSEKKCLEGKIVEQVGNLNSSSSKKCPQVYIDVSGEQPEDKGAKPSQFQKYLNCGFGKLVQGQVPIQKTETLQNITEIQQTLSEGSSPSIELKPVEASQDSWKKICLENVSKIPSPENESKQSFFQRQQKMQEHNIFMRRQMFTRQAVYESMFQRQVNLACQDIVNLKCLQGGKKKNKKVVASSTNFNRGIKTDFSQIKRYIVRFIDYMIDECPTEDLSRTLRNINKSLGPSSKQVLQYLSLREPLDEDSKSSEDSSEYVISISCFQTYETNSTEAKANSKNYAYLYYWHQSLFQAFNECLDEMRPFGVYGQPYLWEIDGRIHKNQTNPQNLRTVMLKAAEKMYSHAAILSGIIFDKEDSPFMQERVLDQTKKQVNQERMSRMLAQMLIQDEPNFINYKDEVVELQIELSYTITEALMRQTVMEIYTIGRCRQRL